jgi:hypothetical protein
MERCELFATENCNTDLQLEDPLSRHAEVKARIKARQADLLSKATEQIGNLAEPLKEWLLNFMEKQGGQLGRRAGSCRAGTHAC